MFREDVDWNLEAGRLLNLVPPTKSPCALPFLTGAILVGAADDPRIRRVAYLVELSGAAIVGRATAAGLTAFILNEDVDEARWYLSRDAGREVAALNN